MRVAIGIAPDAKASIRTAPNASFLVGKRKKSEDGGTTDALIRGRAPVK